MAVIAPFLQRQLYDEAVTEMADELRLKAGLLDSSDSDTSENNPRGTGRRQWELPKADGSGGSGGGGGGGGSGGGGGVGGDTDQVLVPRRSSVDPLRRRKRTGAPSGPEKVSSWLAGSTDWSRQFMRASTLRGSGSGALRLHARHSAGVVAGALGAGGSCDAAGNAAGGGGGGPTRHVVPYEDFNNWWLRFNLRGRLEDAFPVRPPVGRARTAWDMFVMALVLYSAVTVPLAFSYGIPPSLVLTVVEWTVTAVFATDIGINFRTAYYDNDGNLVRDSWPVARRYLAGWFLTDFLATVPFDVLAMAAGLSADSESQLMVLAVLKTPRLLRLVKLMQLLDRVRNANIFKVLQLILLMMMIAHWLACVWYFIARYAPGPQHWGFDTLHDDKKVTWYLSAFYYSFLLLIGDNIQAVNNYERLFFIVALLAGACFYSAVVGNMALLVANMNTVAVRFRQKLDMTQDALRYMRVPEAQRERVQAFYDFITQFSHPGSEGLGFLSELTKGINEDLHIFLHSNTLKGIYLFKECEPAFIRSLAMRMKIVTFIPGEVIFRQGDLGHEMYIIRAGCVAVVSKNNEVMSLLQVGDFFGEIALLTQARRTAKCIALSNCDLAILNSFDIKVLMKEFPQSASRLQEAARGRLRQLQIAGRAGTGAGPDGDGGGDEDLSTRQEREEVWRQRRRAIARFATSRGVQPAQTEDEAGGGGGGTRGGADTEASWTLPAGAARAVATAAGEGGTGAPADDTSTEGGTLPLPHCIESSRNSCTSITAEDSAREFVSRRRTSSVTSQSGPSAGASASNSRRTSNAGATMAAVTTNAMAAAPAGVVRPNTAAKACARLAGQAPLPGSARSAGIATEVGGLSPCNGRSSTSEGGPLRPAAGGAIARPLRLSATGAVSFSAVQQQTAPPASAWSALFTRRAESRLGSAGGSSPQVTRSRPSTAGDAAGAPFVAIAASPAGARAGAAAIATTVGQVSDAGASVADGGRRASVAALDPLMRFDAVENFQLLVAGLATRPHPPAGGRSVGGTSSVGSTEPEPTDPWVRGRSAAQGSCPVAEGVEQFVTSRVRHGASIQARLRPATAAAAAAAAVAATGDGANAAAAAGGGAGTNAATPMVALAAAGRDPRAAPSLGNSCRTSATSVSDSRPVVGTSRAQSSAPGIRRERRASILLPHSASSTTDFATAVAAAIGIALPPTAGGGGGYPIDGSGSYRTRTSLHQHTSGTFADALAATAASVVCNGTAAAAARLTRADSSGPGPLGHVLASASTLRPSGQTDVLSLAAPSPAAAAVAAAAAVTAPLPHASRHAAGSGGGGDGGGGALHAPERATAMLLLPHPDAQGPHCLMRSAAARRAEAQHWHPTEPAESPFATGCIGEGLAAGSGGEGGGGGAPPPSPQPHLLPGGRSLFRRSTDGNFGGCGGEGSCLSPLEIGSRGGLHAMGSAELLQLAPPGYSGGTEDAGWGTEDGSAAAAGGGRGGGGAGRCSYHGHRGSGTDNGGERLPRGRQVRALRRGPQGASPLSDVASIAAADEPEPVRQVAAGGGGGASDEGGDESQVPFMDWISTSRASTARARRLRRQSSCEAVFQLRMVPPGAATVPGSAAVATAAAAASAAGGGSGGGFSAWTAAQLVELHRAEAEHSRREMELARREAELERREAELHLRQAEAAVAEAEAAKRRQEAEAAASALSQLVHGVVLGLAGALTDLVFKIEQLDARLEDADASICRIEAQHGHGRPAGNEFLGLGHPPLPPTVTTAPTGRDARAGGILLERNASIEKRFATLDRPIGKSLSGRLMANGGGGGGGGTRRPSALLFADGGGGGGGGGGGRLGGLLTSGDFFFGGGGNDVSVSGRRTIFHTTSASISGVDSRDAAAVGGGGDGSKSRRPSAVRAADVASVLSPPLGAAAGRMATPFTPHAAVRDRTAPSSPSAFSVARGGASFSASVHGGSGSLSASSAAPSPSSAALFISGLRNSFQRKRSASWGRSLAPAATASAIASATTTATAHVTAAAAAAPTPAAAPAAPAAASSEIEEQP